jgi:hypothetical protein
VDPGRAADLRGARPGGRRGSRRAVLSRRGAGPATGCRVLDPPVPGAAGFRAVDLL